LCIHIADFIITTGGYKEGPLDSVLVQLPSLSSHQNIPNLTEPVYGHSLTYMGDGILIQLGGIGSTHSFKINVTSETPKWEQIGGLEMFNNQSYFSSVKLRNLDRAWVVLNSKLYTINSEGLGDTVNLPFNVSSGHCAVGNDEYMYVIGTGDLGNEIWLNIIPNDPTSFKLVSKIKTKEKLRYSGCTWSGTIISVMSGRWGRLDRFDRIYNLDTLTGQWSSGN